PRGKRAGLPRAVPGERNERRHSAYPLIRTIGSGRATFRDSPARSAASTTAWMSLYAPGASSATPCIEGLFTMIPRAARLSTTCRPLHDRFALVAAQRPARAVARRADRQMLRLLGPAEHVRARPHRAADQHRLTEVGEPSSNVDDALSEPRAFRQLLDAQARERRALHLDARRMLRDVDALAVGDGIEPSPVDLDAVAAEQHAARGHLVDDGIQEAEVRRLAMDF